MWGGVSAISLPLGAVLGLWLRPSNKWTSSLMSFGAGALLAALTLQLVAESLHKVGFRPVAGGLVGGALLFMFLNMAVNSQGGFLRKISTTVGYLTRSKRKKAEVLLELCSRVGILRALPPEEIHAIIPFLNPASFERGHTVFKKDDPGDKLYIIDSGEVEVTGGPDVSMSKIAKLGPGDAFGEMALVGGKPRVATIDAVTDLKTWTLEKKDFDRLMRAWPGLRRAVTELDEKRREDLQRLAKLADEEASRTWAQQAKANLPSATLAPNPADIEEAHAQHGGAAYAIWLGILLDGIPESLVIGGSMITSGHVSLVLIGGVFLANFPEALSSAVGMRKQGSSVGKILWMWTSLTIITAVGALIGYVSFGAFPKNMLAIMQSLAAGAMLAMIAETMLPEAAEQRGPANGLMTVLGFLAAVFVGTLGGH